MSLIKPIKKIKVSSFNDFLNKFNLSSDKIAGEDECDEVLILEKLAKRNDEKWLVDFVDDDKVDGYFVLYLIE